MVEHGVRQDSRNALSSTMCCCILAKIEINNQSVYKTICKQNPDTYDTTTKLTNQVIYD